ncbi:hypothetical protein R3P38DRAFT_2868528 [Favolaschia claudopus]|uniref:RGS domain-containing protein n=1 Tax=Favolaschia claudopus TaxID=2862362 RepID=A0AAW0DAR8_9AGAR
MSTQPRATKLTPKSLLSLPFRLCNPPPAVAKFPPSVTPVFQVHLDDILERKHLPPLGLKDFEEWLLFVEDAVENLYFILWLKEYTIRYREWVAQATYERDNAREYRDWPLQPSVQLAMFYSRAKQTFFTPNAAYELNLPSVAFAPFHASNNSPHPDPVTFTEVAILTRKMLDESLNRFVTAQFFNVGNQRVMCGIVAGTIFCLLGFLTPICFNLAEGRSRWLRLLAFPGFWIGMTVLLASLNGICVGVYVFGDLRQLRSYELSRPAISKPQPFHNSRPRPTISYPVPGVAPFMPPPPRLTIVPPSSDHVRPPRSPSRMSDSSTLSDISDGYSSGETGAIHISPAYYDPDPVEGPATSPIAPDMTTFPSPAKHPSNNPESETQAFPPTAPFIHDFDDQPQDGHSFGRPSRTLPEERQILSAFDFDALPRCSYSVPPPQIPPRTLPQPSRRNSAARVETTTKLRLSPKALIERMQSRCATRWSSRHDLMALHSLTDLQPPINDEKPATRSHHSRDSSHPQLNLPQHIRTVRTVDKSEVDRKFKKVRAVPAFSVPLTPVLSSVIVRGQWEIVTRSALFAFLICWVVLGCLLAVPTPHR